MKYLASCLSYISNSDSRWGTTPTADLLSVSTQLILWINRALLGCSAAAERPARRNTSYLPTERTNGMQAPLCHRASHSAAARPAGAKATRQEDGGDEEAVCPRPAAADTITEREQHRTYCYSHTESRSFFCSLRLCIPVCLPQGYTQYYEKDLSWHESQSLHRRCGGGGGDELFNQPALLGSDVLLCLTGRWGEPATTSGTSSQGGRHMTASG